MLAHFYLYYVADRASLVHYNELSSLVIREKCFYKSYMGNSATC